MVRVRLVQIRKKVHRDFGRRKAKKILDEANQLVKSMLHGASDGDDNTNEG